MSLLLNKRFSAVLLSTMILLAACHSQPKGERFNYTLIKSKLTLTEEQTSKFDDITANYLKKARETFEHGEGKSKEVIRKTVKDIFVEQDSLIKVLIGDDQYTIYAAEIKIEREGREKYNMTLIRDELALDSAQMTQYNIANEAFYTLLINNHDNYHGKPDVYKQYYAEIDVSRQKALKKLMTTDQYDTYLGLFEKYKIGKSEAY